MQGKNAGIIGTLCINVYDHAAAEAATLAVLGTGDPPLPILYTAGFTFFLYHIRR